MFRKLRIPSLFVGVALSGATALSLGAVSSGCLTRPVEATTPDTKTTFFNRIKQTNIDKVDILFGIDNSKSMGDKQDLLRLAVPNLIGRLLDPQCIDQNDEPKGPSAIDDKGNADCSAFAGTRPEFPPVHDLHVGIVTSSLGPLGSDSCRPSKIGGLDTHQDDRAELINRAGKDETPVPNMGTSNYLAWFPNVDANKGKTSPTGTTAITKQSDFESSFRALVSGVKEFGCGYEAQLESVYRFLVQPDPYESIQTDDPNLGNFPTARYVGVNKTILKQRRDFLRPDSLVAVIMLTDENESTVDPMALGGHGYVYLLDSNIKGGTKECESDPLSSGCTSCYFVNDEGRCPGGNFLNPTTDASNLRFWDMKRRFGVDPRYPYKRYVDGFRNARVPNRFGEHPLSSDGKNNPSNNYVGDANCSNPLFSIDLPGDVSGDSKETIEKELCNLAPGGRSSDQVFLAVIGGVPWQLLTDAPDQLTKNSGGKFKTTLDDSDWLRILGKDQEKFDYTGISPFMKVTPEKRSDVPSPNEVNSREWDTKNADLQYACTFDLPTSGDVTQKDCTAAAGQTDACPCFKNGDSDPNNNTDSPLCQSSSSTRQVAAKAYPTIRQFQVVQELRSQGIIASICPRTLEGSTTSENYGYNPAVRTIVDRLRDALAAQCLPQKLYDEKNPPADGLAPCQVIEQLATPGGQELCEEQGRINPDAKTIKAYRDAQKEELGNADIAKAQEQFPVCLIPQLSGADLSNGTCEESNKVGWCYVTGSAAGKCSQALKFTKSAIGKGSTVRLQCIEKAAVPEN